MPNPFTEPFTERVGTPSNPTNDATSNSFDGRQLALNVQSWQLLQSLVDELPMNQTIDSIRVSQQRAVW